MFTLHAKIENEELQLKFPFPDDYEICISNSHPLDSKMGRIYPKFIGSIDNKLCQKGDDNDK